MNLIIIIRKEKIWHRKALLIDIYHSCKNNTIIETAKQLEMSVGYVSEDLRLAEIIRADNTITELSRNLALRRLREEKK